MAEDSQDLTVLRQKRGQIKAQLTRFETFFSTLSSDNLHEAIIKELGNRLNKIQGCFEKFDEIQNMIDMISPDNSDKDRLNFENEFFTITSKAEVFIDHFFRPPVKEGGSKRDNNDDVTSVRSSGGTRQHIKLPTIKLPTYDGRYEKFLEFRDLFMALVDQNSDLTDIEKFYHLKMSLSEEPRKLISKIDTTAENYAVAWQLLLDRYENKSLMIHNHIKAIFETPVLQKESHIELRHLTDNINDHLLSLKTLGENIETWDRLIIYIITQKLDETSRREWESYKISGELATMTDMKIFLNERCQILEKLSSVNRQNPIKNNTGVKNDKFNKYKSSYSLHSNEPICYFCSKNHTMYTCGEFLKCSIPERISEVKKRKLCLNCFSPNHGTTNCRFRKCIKCKKAHNSLIHLNLSASNKHECSTNGDSGEPLNTDSVTVTNISILEKNCFIAQPLTSQVLLSTARVKIQINDNIFKARLLLDSGSQSNFVTESFCHKIGVSVIPINHTIKGIGEETFNIKKRCNITICSLYNDFSANIECLIINKITGKLPKMSFCKKALNIPTQVNLTDPNFNESADIDILLGVQVFWQILTKGQKILGTELPILQNSKLGWIIAGNLGYNGDNTSFSHLILDNDTEINNLVSKFWNLENVNNKKVLSVEDEYCEKYFVETLQKDETGRLIVRIPFKENLNNLGNSRDIAKNRFVSVEKKLLKDTALRNEYVKFMEEYENLGHMTEVSLENSENKGYYIPHHAVIKTSSLTTKCRVVFNASCPTDNGLSLNDVQFVGPKLQNEIFDILARFRIYKYVIAGDISKMYRQILINPKDRRYQQIFWRANPNQELKCYQLNTVSYGTASAPFLALRSLVQLANENATRFPVISNIIRNDFYVDDLLTGANSDSEMLQIQNDISKILCEAGFVLRKWLCNDRTLLPKFSVNDNTDANFVTIGENENNKTLGIYWNASNDNLQYFVNFKNNEIITKRHILSIICQIYDPLGLINPIVVIGKLFMQELWKIKGSWDDEVPEKLKISWLKFKNDLDKINILKIPRMCVFSDYSIIQIHGFSDASEKAYGALWGIL